MLSTALVIRGSQFDILSGGLNNTLPAKLCQGFSLERLIIIFQSLYPQSGGNLRLG
jgi:hypothetical protein